MNSGSSASDYDIAILGGGASGLLLLYRMLHDADLKSKRIVLVEKEEKSTNDRTWCYWEKGKGIFDDLLFKEYPRAVFKNEKNVRDFSLAPYSYKMLRSGVFYKRLHTLIAANSNVTLMRQVVTGLEDRGDRVVITTTSDSFTAGKCFSSIRLDAPQKQAHKHPWLQQHFTGWFVETEKEIFDPEKVTLMDFSVPQSGNTRFMYVLPETSRKALVEYTLFSADLLSKEAYEDALRSYLATHQAGAYKVLETEHGVIPMTTYPFHRANSANLLYIGTAGGWTKPSTGYTFQNAVKRSASLVQFLKTGKHLSEFHCSGRFDFYDEVFLRVLSRDNQLGSALFSKMFLKGDTESVFRFLDNETSLQQEVPIMWRMPQWPFIKQAFKVIFS